MFRKENVYNINDMIKIIIPRVINALQLRDEGGVGELHLERNQDLWNRVVMDLKVYQLCRFTLVCVLVHALALLFSYSILFAVVVVVVVLSFSEKH